MIFTVWRSLQGVDGFDKLLVGLGGLQAVDRVALALFLSHRRLRQGGHVFPFEPLLDALGLQLHPLLTDFAHLALVTIFDRFNVAAIWQSVP